MDLPFLENVPSVIFNVNKLNQNLRQNLFYLIAKLSRFMKHI